jgi:hypothetical protein
MAELLQKINRKSKPKLENLMRNAPSITLVTIALLFFALAPAIAEDSYDPDTWNDTKETAELHDVENYAWGEIGADNDWDDWYVLSEQDINTLTITLGSKCIRSSECDVDLEIWCDDDMIGGLYSADNTDTAAFDVYGTVYLHVYFYAYEEDGSFESHAEYSIGFEPIFNYQQRFDDFDSEEEAPVLLLEVDDTNGFGEECAGLTEVEPNGTTDTATYTDALTIEGYACEGDVDLFILQGQAGTNPTITATYDAAACDVDLEIYSDGEYIGKLDSPDSPDQGQFNIPGECWIKAVTWHGEGNYTIEITP